MLEIQTLRGVVWIGLLWCGVVWCGDSPPVCFGVCVRCPGRGTGTQTARCHCHAHGRCRWLLLATRGGPSPMGKAHPNQLEPSLAHSLSHTPGSLGSGLKRTSRPRHSLHFTPSFLFSLLRLSAYCLACRHVERERESLRHRNESKSSLAHKPSSPSHHRRPSVLRTLRDVPVLSSNRTRSSTPKADDDEQRHRRRRPASRYPTTTRAQSHPPSLIQTAHNAHVVHLHHHVQHRTSLSISSNIAIASPFTTCRSFRRPAASPPPPPYRILPYQHSLALPNSSTTLAPSICLAPRRDDAAPGRLC